MFDFTSKALIRKSLANSRLKIGIHCSADNVLALINSISLCNEIILILLQYVNVEERLIIGISFFLSLISSCHQIGVKQCHNNGRHHSIFTISTLHNGVILYGIFSVIWKNGKIFSFSFYDFPFYIEYNVFPIFLFFIFVFCCQCQNISTEVLVSNDFANNNDNNNPIDIYH